MKGWAWILIGGGAFTMVAGWLASRAKAQTTSGTTPASLLPGGTVVPTGLVLSNAEIAAINANPGPTSDRNALLVAYAAYKNNFQGFVQMMAANGVATANDANHTPIANLPQGMNLMQFASYLH